LGTAGVAPAPPPELAPPELPPPEPPLDAELLVPALVVVLGSAPVSLQYVGPWVQVEVPAVWAATGDVANNSTIRNANLMSKPRNRFGSDDSGVAPLACLL
jgi:hypothetical protein